MNQIKSFLNYHWKYGGIAFKIIALNVFIFLIYNGINFIFSYTNYSISVNWFFNLLFVAETSFIGVIQKPWAIITHLFFQKEIWHLIFNVVLLFFIKERFIPLFGEKRFISVYFIGGIFGYFMEVFFSNIFSFSIHGVIGASGAIMAVLFAIISYSPKKKIRLFGLFSIPFYVLGVVIIAGDLLGIFRNDNVAHFSHLGGAFIGFLAGYKNAKKNTFNYLFGMFKQKVKKTKKKQYSNNDYEYVSQKKDEEKEIDVILDKIKISGYDSLTKKEKERLFRASHNEK